MPRAEPGTAKASIRIHSVVEERHSSFFTGNSSEGQRPSRWSGVQEVECLCSLDVKRERKSTGWGSAWDPCTRPERASASDVTQEGQEPVKGFKEQARSVAVQMNLCHTSLLIGQAWVPTVLLGPLCMSLPAQASPGGLGQMPIFCTRRSHTPHTSYPSHPPVWLVYWSPSPNSLLWEQGLGTQ